MEAFGRRIRAGADSWLSVIVIAALTGVVLYQHWQAAHPHRPQPVREGERVEAIDLRTTQKSAMHIDWGVGGRGTILYVMSPDCVWCLKNLDAAKSAYQQASLLGYRFIGVSLRADGLNEYLLRYRIPFPTYIDQNRSAERTLKVIGTPETLIVSPSGTVQKVSVGVYTGRNAEEMEKFLGSKTPASASRLSSAKALLSRVAQRQQGDY
jgi:hypothetical protein